MQRTEEEAFYDGGMEPLHHSALGLYTTNAVASLAVTSGVTYIVGLVESIEKMTIENWRAVNSARGVVSPKTLS